VALSKSAIIIERVKVEGAVPCSSYLMLYHMQNNLRLFCISFQAECVALYISLSQFIANIVQEKAVIVIQNCNFSCLNQTTVGNGPIAVAISTPVIS
jgi:hypothetical protein